MSDRHVCPHPLGCLLLAAMLAYLPIGVSGSAQAAEFHNPNLVATLIHNTVLALNHAKRFWH